MPRRSDLGSRLTEVEPPAAPGEGVAREARASSPFGVLSPARSRRGSAGRGPLGDRRARRWPRSPGRSFVEPVSGAGGGPPGSTLPTSARDLIHSRGRMNAHSEDVEAGHKGHQGAPRSLSLRRRTPRAAEGRGAGGPAACSGTRGGEARIGVGRWPDRGRSEPAGGGRASGPAVTDGRGKRAWVDVDAAAGSEMSGSGHRFLDLGTVKVRSSYMWTPVPRSGNLGAAGHRFLDLGTWVGIEVSISRHQVPKYGHRCLHLGTACRLSKGSADESIEGRAD